ncbi:MAG: SPOR domain-containing protein [Bacteroidales bacterium]|jgi:hypothetical protein|nr:SPOR domain-containing protein [Bacteroidales bacterium]
MKQSIFFLFFVFFIVFSSAQENISFNSEDGIDIVEQQYIDNWKKIKRIDGFRIQITSFSGVNSKNSIENADVQFKQQFPEILSYVSYSEPNFRLRVGNYHTKLEAYKALQKISPSFLGAFVLKDQILIK